MQKIIGIDPGLSGAIAVLDKDTNSIIDVIDMPTYEAHGKKHVDAQLLGRFIASHASKTRLAVIEEVGAMPKQGLSSTFKFGLVTGVAIGVLGANYIKTVGVLPAVWKPFLGLSRNKDDSRNMATRLYPGDAHRWKRKKDDGRAEAVLLAMLGLKMV